MYLKFILIKNYFLDCNVLTVFLIEPNSRAKPNIPIEYEKLGFYSSFHNLKTRISCKCVVVHMLHVCIYNLPMFVNPCGETKLKC